MKVILNRDGRPSGDALAEFDSEEAVQKAMEKDRESMGSRYVVLTRDGMCIIQLSIFHKKSL